MQHVLIKWPTQFCMHEIIAFPQPIPFQKSCHISVRTIGIWYLYIMMTSSDGNIFRITGPVCREFTSHRWIHLTKASDFLFICAWTNGWVNNQNADDLRHYRAHYDVTNVENVVGWLLLGLLSRHVEVVIKLTHWGRDKMAAVSQTTLSNAFSWIKILEFRLKFHWSLFLRVQLTIFQHWFR